MGRTIEVDSLRRLQCPDLPELHTSEKRKNVGCACVMQPLPSVVQSQNHVTIAPGILSGSLGEMYFGHQYCMRGVSGIDSIFSNHAHFSVRRHI